MLPFVGTKDERTGSVIKQVKRNVLLNNVSQLSDLETDRCNNENKKSLHKFCISLLFMDNLSFLTCKRESNNLYNFK